VHHVVPPGIVHVVFAEFKSREVRRATQDEAFLYYICGHRSGLLSTSYIFENV